METSSRIVMQGSASIELATISVNGSSFTNLGSVVDTSAGFVVGYPKGNELQTWNGSRICSLTITGRIPARWQGNRWLPELTCYRATIDGRRYHGRGQGDGMLLRMRAGRAE